MRCIGTEGVGSSKLAHSPSSLLLQHHPYPGPDLDDITMTSTITDEIINVSPFPPCSSAAESKSSVSSNSSSPESSQLGHVSTKSDGDLFQCDSPVLKDFTAAITIASSARFVRLQQVSSMSSPELNILTEACSKRTSSGLSSTTFSSFSSSLSVCDSGKEERKEEDSETESSLTSTAQNTLSSGSSLNTVAEEVFSSRATTSSSEILNSPDTNESQVIQEKISGDRKTSDGCVRFEGISSDPPKHHQSQLDSSVLQKQKVEDAGQENRPIIQLPERYRHVLTNSNCHSNAVSRSGRKSSGGGGGEGDEGEEDLRSREKDLGTALAWIRHEMVQMKEQDKMLLKRFIELRASILQLRCTYGSSPDICSMDGSTVSLNELRKSARMRNADSDAMLAERMYTATSSLSLPCSPQLSRLRWRSDELM